MTRSNPERGATERSPGKAEESLARCRRRPGLGWALVVVVGATAGFAPVWAEEPPPSPDRIERWHSWVESALTWTGVGIDSFFDAHSPDGMELPTEESYGRIRLYPHYDDGDLGFGAQASATLGLPNMERWFKLRFTTTPVDALPGADPTAVETSPRLGTDVPIIRRARFSLDADLNVGWSGGIDPYAGLRGKLELPWGRWTTRVVARQFWRHSDGFGHFTELYFDRPIGKTLLLRFISAYKWTQVEHELESSQTARLGWILRTEKRYILFAATMFGRDRLVERYRVEVTLRLRTRYRWCYVELTPGGDFPRDQRFSFQARARVGLDVPFGGRPSL